MRQISSCLIVGAGISGLLAARTLSERGIKVTVIEKSSGVGGRMASRRMSQGICDHGAQFISVTSKKFGAMLAEWQRLGLASVWADGFPYEGGISPGPAQSRFRGVPTMTAIPKHLASGIQIHLGYRALRADPTSSGWLVMTDVGIEFSTGALIVTPPLPQAISLFPSLSEKPSPITFDPVRKIDYDCAFAALYVLGEVSQIPSPGALHVAGDVVSWIADNSQKGISPGAVTLTVHTTPAFSAAHFEAPDEEILGMVTREIDRYVGGEILERRLHRWRYSKPTSIHHQLFFVASDDPVLIFAGDAFGGPRVEGAALSGLAAAEHLLSTLL